MATDLISKVRVVQLQKPKTATGAGTSTLTECDIGSAYNGLFIIAVDAKTAGTTALSNITLYTSETSNFTATTGTNGVSDLTQSLSNSTAAATITSGVIDAVSSDGIYVFEATNLKRYVTAKVDGISGDTTTIFQVALVTTNLGEAPYKPYTATY